MKNVYDSLAARIARGFFESLFYVGAILFVLLGVFVNIVVVWRILKMMGVLE